MEKKWKKPGKRFLQQHVKDFGYIPIKFNGKVTGWSDGHIAFLDIVPSDGVPDKGARKDIDPMRIEIESRRGKFTGSPVKFDNPLHYLGSTDDNSFTYAFFERVDGIKHSDFEYPVAIDDNYLNAIMYYAKKGRKDAKVEFFLLSESTYGLRQGRERDEPILVTVNEKAFAFVMPVRQDDWTIERVKREVAQ